MVEQIVSLSELLCLHSSWKVGNVNRASNFMSIWGGGLAAPRRYVHQDPSMLCCLERCVELAVHGQNLKEFCMPIILLGD